MAGDWVMTCIGISCLALATAMRAMMMAADLARDRRSDREDEGRKWASANRIFVSQLRWLTGMDRRVVELECRVIGAESDGEFELPDDLEFKPADPMSN